jgi:hypothetical protein
MSSSGALSKCTCPCRRQATASAMSGYRRFSIRTWQMLARTRHRLGDPDHAIQAQQMGWEHFPPGYRSVIKS